MTTETKNIRAELTGNYCFVRSLEEKGGVIDALVSENKAAKVKSVLENADGKTFSQVWSEMNQIKGVRFSYQAN